MKKIDLDVELPPPANPDELIAFFQSPAQEEFMKLATHYIELDLLPPLLAERLRRRGDEGATRRDFECMCMTNPETDLPYCEAKFADCRFLGSTPPPTENRLVFKSPKITMGFDFLGRLLQLYFAAPEDERSEMLAFLRRAVARRGKALMKRQLRNSSTPSGAGASESPDTDASSPEPE